MSQERKCGFYSKNNGEALEDFKEPAGGYAKKGQHEDKSGSRRYHLGAIKII